MSQAVKVYYIENQATKEIRKFSLEADVAGNFEYLSVKIRRTFPDLLRKDIQIFWKDAEDDFVTISSDGELDEALGHVYLNDGLLKLYVKHQQGETQQNENNHPGITCDGCEKSVKGSRFKCTQCFDYDLCSNCESKNVHPADHEMMCIKVPRTSDHFMRHPGFMRGGCRRGGPSGGRGQFGGRGGPFGGRGRCSFGGSFPFGGMFQSFADTTQQQQKENVDTSKSEGEKCTTEECGDFVGMMASVASTFGLDPEVAKTQFTTFCDDLKRRQEEQAKTSDKDENEENKKDSETPQDKSVDVDFEKEILSESAAKSNEDVPMDEQSSDENKDSAKFNENTNEFKSELESMVGHFSEQFGLTPEAQGNIGLKGGLNNLLQGLFGPTSFENQGCTFNDKDHQTEQTEESTKEEPKKPDGFIFVDKEKEGEKSLTEEEKYQQRLVKALKQMETMGFDNEGGWLKQLLIAKELSIGRVLDALNPSS